MQKKQKQNQKQKDQLKQKNKDKMNYVNNKQKKHQKINKK